MIPKGYKIDQRYTVEKVLGEGLSGEVLLVADESGLQALKFLKKVQMNLSRDEALQNFKNEFSILQELNHPNISRILDFGYDSKLQKYYLTTEFVAGGDLESFCSQASMEEKERLIVEVLRALSYLHSRGIFHFDIKPQNILVGKNEVGDAVAKVIDFGLAGYASPGKKVGTPIYMAPEVLQGGHLDGRTDLYSMGVLIYKILTGINPFAGKSFQEIADRQLNFIPSPVTSVNAQVNEWWNHIVARLLMKDPNQRYAQAAMVIRDLNFLSAKKFAIETKDTKLSYLPEKGTLIAREKAWEQCTQAFLEIYEKNNTAADRLLIVEGEKGTGKTRLLNELKAFSQLQNVPVLTLVQYQQQKEHPERYLLLLDQPHLTINEINTVLIEHLTKTVLVIWAIEKAPKNWSGSQIVHLQCYNKTELKTYVESVTGLSHAPQVWIDEIFKRTQGNPLFVAELIKSLLDQNLFYDESGKWEVSTLEDVKIDFSKIHIPASVEDVLKEKFLQLNVQQQNILAWLAVNRAPLTQHDFAQILAGKSLQVDLQALVGLDFLEYQLFNKVYAFKNLVFQDLICALLSTDDLQNKHKVLEQHFAKSATHRDLQLYHQSFAADVAVAKDAMVVLAEQHLQKNDYNQAIDALKRYVNLAAKKFQLTDQNIFLRLGHIYTLSGLYRDATVIYLSLFSFLKNEKQATVADRLTVCLKIIDLYNKQNLLEQVEEYCEIATRFLSQAADQKIITMILANYQAHLQFKRGEIDAAFASFSKTRTEWLETLSASEKQQVMNNRLVDIYFLREEFDKAIAFSNENIAVLQGSENHYDLALNWYAYGDYCYRQSFLLSGDQREGAVQKFWAECERSFKICVDTTKKTGHATLLLRAYNGLGNLFYARQDIATAQDYYKRTLNIAQKINDFESSAHTAFNIANIYTSQKNFHDAYSYLVFAVNTFENLEQITPQSESVLYLAHLSLSEVYYQQNALQKASESIDKAQAIFAGNQAVHHYEYWMTIRRALVCAKQNEMIAAQNLYAKAKRLAKTDEEKLDLKAAELILNVPATQEMSIEQGVHIMSTNLSNTSSTASLNKIIEINQIMNSEHDVHKLLTLVLDYAIKLTQAQGGAVLLVDDSAGSLTVAESLHLTSDERNQISLSIAKQALSTGEIVEATDALSDERFDGSQSIVVNELQSVLCLPIRSKNRSVGVFYLDNRAKKNAFENTDVNVLKAFCDQVGIAIENAKLVSELKEAKEELKQDLSRKEEELEDVRHRLHEEVGQYHNSFGKNIISKSKPMHEIFRLMDKIMKANLAIFIYGESGTGKELIAKALHYNNPARAKGKFVAINCGAIPSNLMESELFGHKQGSFTGAVRDKKGMFEEANGGTLFLDEIGELPLELQVKLLRVLQEGEVQRIGETRPIKVDVRVISASHQDIEGMTKRKSFREDLYYRLCQMKLSIPSLRERPEDIPELVKHFVKKYAKDNSLEKTPEVPSEFLKALLDYQWPGNIRELENLISVACALSDDGRLRLQNLPEHYAINKKPLPLQINMATQNTTSVVLPQIADEPDRQSESLSAEKIDERNFYDPSLSWYDYEAIIIAKAFEASGWKKKQVANWLDMSHSTVYKKIDDYGLDDRKNRVYQNTFVYDPKNTLKDYVQKVFLASLKHHENHPYAAIKVLDVSQGYFYKVTKDKRPSHDLQMEAI